MIAPTPEPPYWAVIFTSVRADGDGVAYADMAVRMESLAAEQPGFLGIESAREAVGITVSYWATEEDVRAWRRHAEHLVAQRLGRTRWYREYALRVCRVERVVSFSRDADSGSGDHA